MNKRKLLLCILSFICLFSFKNVYADVDGCERVNDPWSLATSIKLHDTTRKNYSIGDKVYVDTFGLPSNAPINVAVILNPKSGEKVTNLRVYLKNLEGNANSSGKAYFIIPDYATVGDEYEIAQYNVYKTTDEKYLTSYGETNKVVCAYFTTNKDKQTSTLPYMNVSGSVTEIKISEKSDAEGDPVGYLSKSKLNDISMDKTTGYLGGKLKFKVSLTNPTEKVLVSLYDSYTGRYISGYLKNYDKTATEFEGELDIPTSARTTTYLLQTVELIDEDNSYRIYQEGMQNVDPHFEVLEKKIYVTIGESISNILSETGIVINELKLEKDKEAQGATIPVALNIQYGSSTITRDVYGPSISIRSLLLNFVSESGEDMFSTYVKGLKAKTSFVIPSSAKYGTYKLKSIVATLDSYVGETNNIVFNDTMTYGEYSNIFSQKLTVEKGEPESYLYFMTDKLDQEAIEMIKDSKEDAVITVSAEEQSVIPSDVFDAIKESQRQLIVEYNKNEWVFNGTDIVDSKAVDVSMKFYELDKLENLDKIKSSLSKESIIIEFPENGSLPGKALIRIKDSEVFDRLNGDKFYIYHIDEKNNKLNKVAYELQKSYNGYIEFYINHNSKYVLTSEEIKDENIIGKDDDMMKVNAKTTGEENTADNTPLYIALGASIAVIVVLVIVILVRKPKKVESAPVEKPAEEPKVEAALAPEPKVEEAPVPEAPAPEPTTPEEPKSE